MEGSEQLAETGRWPRAVFRKWGVASLRFWTGGWTGGYTGCWQGERRLILRNSGKGKNSSKLDTILWMLGMTVNDKQRKRKESERQSYV